MNVKGKKVVVLGLGESGRAAAELLVGKGAEVVVRDNAMNERVARLSERLGQMGVRVEIQEKNFTPCRFDLGVLSPGIDPRRPLVSQLREQNTPVIGELELAYRFCECPIVAITGTNGKSTTTELVAAVFEAGGKSTVACGNIGQAFSEAVKRSADLDVMAVEVSSFQLEAIEQFRPRISVYLNFTPDHLDRYATMEEYKAAKARIFANQTESDFAVVSTSCDDPSIRAKKITLDAYGGPADYTFENGVLKAFGKDVLEQGKTLLAGPHNAENQLAALAVGDIYGIPREKTIEALRAYRALPHRCEPVRELDGVTYINDSKGTNIDALEKALLAQDRPVVLIAGGKDKGVDFAGLAGLLAKKVRHAVLIGEMQSALNRAWGQTVPCHRAVDLEDAVVQARRLAKAGWVVLLSPGCSSYDMFKNFEERGNLFRQAVKDLA